MQLDPWKLHFLTIIPNPQKDLQSFLGIVNYFSKHSSVIATGKTHIGKDIMDIEPNIQCTVKGQTYNEERYIHEVLQQKRNIILRDRHD